MEQECENFKCMMQRAHIRGADDYIHKLVDFARETALASNALNRAKAESLFCMEPHCYNRPTDCTPDGHGFCGEHAHVMD